MQPTPAPEPYTLPFTIRITRKKFIGISVLWLLLIAIPGYYLATTNPVAATFTWILCILFAAGLLLCFFGAITHEIRLIEDRIYYREWFYWRQIDYERITAVRFYYWIGNHGVKHPMLEFSMDTGDKIPMDLNLYNSPVNRFIIYDVLKKNARREDLSTSPEEFFCDPDITPWIGNRLPVPPYILPLTMQMDRITFITVSVICLPFIAMLLWFAAFANPPDSIVGWVLGLLLAAGVGLLYLNAITHEIRLTEDRISYREWFYWKEMEYRRITVVRFSYQDMSSVWTSGQLIALSGDADDKITMNLDLFDSPANLLILYDVLKKKAPQAGLRNSPGVFFAHPDAIVNS